MRATSPLVTVADARGWTHVEPPSYAKMVVSIRGLRVTVRSHDGEGWRLDVRVATPNPGLPEFRITREGFVSFIAGAFGGQDLQTGVRNFDYEYRVRSPEPDELRRVWTADRCRFLLDHVTGAVASATHQ